MMLRTSFATCSIPNAFGSVGFTFFASAVVVDVIDAGFDEFTQIVCEGIGDFLLFYMTPGIAAVRWIVATSQYVIVTHFVNAVAGVRW